MKKLFCLTAILIGTALICQPIVEDEIVNQPEIAMICMSENIQIENKDVECFGVYEVNFAKRFTSRESVKKVDYPPTQLS